MWKGRRAAACVNIIGPVRSVYRWKDAVEDASEYLLIVKTMEELAAEVRRIVEEAHSYEVPELITIAIDGGSDKYLEWIAESVQRR